MHASGITGQRGGKHETIGRDNEGEDRDGGGLDNATAIDPAQRHFVPPLLVPCRRAQPDSVSGD
jgi:hypothetical protein